ncbi:MAG TPA: HAMP domain-containing protein [Trebonia sp.]|jgi:signal transduction histidine kinase/CheY-like chemotaxis protein/HAMP domain-containing protein|nr:HAMP domain-containing protein [Trebonia sp.]
MTDVDQRPRLDRSALEQLLAGLTAVRGGDFSMRLAATGDPLMDDIAGVFNGMADQLDVFTSEVTRVSREVGTEGKLGGQARVPGVSGTWQDLTESVNAMAGNLTTQVRNIAQVATAVAKGDLTQKIDVDAQGEILELKTTLNTMVDQLSAFADEVTRVAREVGTQGNLGGQAVVHGVSGTWKDLTDNVNSMANNLTNQVRNIAQVTTAVAQGDLSKKIDVAAQGEILELKTTINTMVDQLSAFAAEVTRVAREVGRDGRLGGQAEVEGVSGTWKRLTENVNELAGNLTRQVRAISQVASAVAAGDLTRSISVEAEGEVAELKDNINAMVESLREMVHASSEQDWLKTNLATISSMLQGHRDLEVVGDLIMDELTPLVNAQHGTFFLAEEGDGETRLRLIAGYGLRADKDAPIQYRIGQSLIGQVAKSKRPIVVDQIPQGYIRISSGLGEAEPANLAVLPIMFEDQVIGVIELASFTRFAPVQIAFLEQLTDTLGVSVNALIANSRTDALLSESQRLTAELQARSEELQARSEELQRSNADLEDKAALLAAQKTDIEAKNTEIERAREEIEERAQQLALASQYKSQFLANMSHELRTPLNSLLILARLLAQNPGGNLTAKQVEYANVIHSAGSDLLQLISDILDLSKVEAGRMDVHVERFPLSALVEDMQTTFGPLTAEKGLDFAVSVAPSAPSDLVTDRQRLRQVLGNLLSNAVKFTEHGRVTLRVASSDVGAGAVSFAVSDTGIGIAPQNLETIFGAFQQGDGTLSRRYGGTGLGLSIASEVGALLGGWITAASDLGRGSTFTLHLPAELPESEPDAVEAAGAMRAVSAGGRGGPGGAGGAGGVRRAPVNGGMVRDGVVRDGVVPGQPETAVRAVALPPTAGLSPATSLSPAGLEAGPAGRGVLVLEGATGGLLTLLAHSAVSDLANLDGAVRVGTATNPDQALRMLADGTFRCAVVDLALPAAAEFLERVQEEPGLRDIPLLAQLDRRPDGAGSGERAVPPLPPAARRNLQLLPSLDELRERVTLYLSGPPREQAAPVGAEAAAPAPRSGSAPGTVAGTVAGTTPGTGAGTTAAGQRHSVLAGRNVLVIDDDARNVFAITSALELTGMAVSHAGDGKHGIEALLAAPGTDIVLMDVMMPGMDGYATMTAIRRMPQFAALPIVAVTARAMPGDREKSLAAGASDYVTKPVDTDELLACIDRLLPPRA